MPKLVFHDSDGVDKTLPLATTEVTIGRASDCEVQTHDAMVSRKHARISWDGGSYWVEDLGSANGVFLGQDKVQRAQFRPGDVLTCGSLVIRMVPEARRSQPPGPTAFEPPSPRPAPVEVRPQQDGRPASRKDVPRHDARRAPLGELNSDEPIATSAIPALAGVAKNDVELKQLRADLLREVERREQAEAALLTAEHRAVASEQREHELVQLRRRVEQRDADIRRLEAQREAPAFAPVDLSEVGEAVAVFNDALAEVKAHLRAAADESKLLVAPAESVKIVRDALRGALDELDRARARLREMVRMLGLPDA